MFRKKTPPKPVRRVVYGNAPVSQPVPIEKPNDIIQLTPIVQPISMVPYGTMNQPLYQYVYDEDGQQ
ncbi:MAG: hypothetical protein LBQ40_07780 [Clostridiales bacterium]|jgi:hypothetical protein|nr:hypothetical protein [Clostridiales bacterium]